MLKGYDREILYHLGKANVVVDALILKAVCIPIGDVCLSMMIISHLLDLIKKA